MTEQRLGEHHHNWKGDAAGKSAKRFRAHRFPLGPCEECGKPGIDRHHKDGDVGDNARENVAILCRKCHMLADGRLAAFLANNPAPNKRVDPVPCRVCRRPAKPLRRGRCSACDMFFRRHGVEWTPEVFSTKARIEGVLNQTLPRSSRPGTHPQGEGTSS
jgi:hypothetical protein